MCAWSLSWEKKASRLDCWQRTIAANALCITVSSDACYCLGNFNFSDRSGGLCCSYCLKIKSELVLAFKAREEKKGETSSALRLNRQHPARPHLYLISAEISVEAQQRCIKCNCFHAKTNISRAPCVTDGLRCSLKQTSNLHSNLLLSSAGAAFKQPFFLSNVWNIFLRQKTKECIHKYVGMQGDLWAPFNVRPVVLIANVGRELIGATKPKKSLQLICSKLSPHIRTSTLGPVLVTNHF